MNTILTLSLKSKHYYYEQILDNISMIDILGNSQ